MKTRVSSETVLLGLICTAVCLVVFRMNVNKNHIKRISTNSHVSKTPNQKAPITVSQASLSDFEKNPNRPNFIGQTTQLQIKTSFDLKFSKNELNLLNSYSPSYFLKQSDLPLDQKQTLVNTLIEKFSTCLRQKTFCGQEAVLRSNGAKYFSKKDSPAHQVLRGLLKSIESYEDEKTGQVLHLSTERAVNILNIDSTPTQLLALKVISTEPQFQDWDRLANEIKALDDKAVSRLGPYFLSELLPNDLKQNKGQQLIRRLKSIAQNPDRPEAADTIRDNLGLISNSPEEYVANYNRTCHLLKTYRNDPEYVRGFNQTFISQAEKSGFDVNIDMLNCH